MTGASLSDLHGWSHMGPLRHGHYDIYRSPDGKRLAVVHLQDEDVVAIMERATGNLVYIHPNTRRGLKHVGISVQRFTQMLKEEWRDE